MDTHKMTKEEFKKYSSKDEFINLSLYDKFNIVWFRLDPTIRKVLFKIVRENTIQQIKGQELEHEIFRLFKEATYVQINIENVIQVIKDFDDDLPLNIT